MKAARGGRPRELLGGLPWHYSTNRGLWVNPDGTLSLCVMRWRKRESSDKPTPRELYLADCIVERFTLESDDGGQTWRR